MSLPDIKSHHAKGNAKVWVDKKAQRENEEHGHIKQMWTMYTLQKLHSLAMFTGLC